MGGVLMSDVDLLAVLAEVMPDLPEVGIEPHTGRGAYGDTWGPSVPVTAFVDQARRLVRAADGSQVVSETTLYARLDVEAPPRSRVTLPDGSRTLVIAAHRRDGYAAGLPAHLEIVCE
jgi:hypothetical protein